jgi:hypothetical protein
VADFCEGGDEPSGSVKVGIFLDQLNTCHMLEKLSI